MLGPRIKERMRVLGIETQVELAEKSGLSPQSISALIRGTRGNRIEHQTVARLARALKVPQKFFSPDSTTVEKSNEDFTSVESGEGNASHG